MPLPQHGRPVVLSFFGGRVFGPLFKCTSQRDHVCAAFRCCSTDGVTASSAWEKKRKEKANLLSQEIRFMCELLLLEKGHVRKCARRACAYLRCIRAPVVYRCGVCHRNTLKFVFATSLLILGFIFGPFPRLKWASWKLISSWLLMLFSPGGVLPMRDCCIDFYYIKCWKGGKWRWMVKRKQFGDLFWAILLILLARKRGWKAWLLIQQSDMP